MKKNYLSLICITLLSVSAFGQSRVYSSKKEKGSTLTNTQIKPIANIEKATPLWSDDFSTPANWAFANTSNPPGNWIITNTTATTIGYNTGAWTDAANTVTNENGYALYDSDANGTSAASVQNATITLVNPITVLSTYSNLTIDFNQRIRKFTNTQTFVGVSTDAGATWNEIPVNASKPTAVTFEEPVSINISALAGNAASVLIRFRYAGSWDYLWAVDDVAIYEQPANDIQVLSAYFAGTNNQGTEYGRTPLNQVDDSYLVGLQVYNFGTVDQTNVTAATTYSFTTAPFSFGTIPSGDTVTLENTESPVLAIGTYNGNFNAISTEEIGGDYFANNSFERNFAITDNEYSQDGIGVYDPNNLLLGSLGTNSFDGGEDGLIIAASYHIKETDDFYALKVMLANGTVEGATVLANIFDTATFLMDDITPMYASSGSTVTNADIANGYIIIPFDEIITLNPGCYYAGVECYSGNNAFDVRVLDDQTVAQPGLASVIFIPNDQVYTNGVAAGVRLLNANGVGLNELALKGVKVYPNPSTGIVNVSNDLNVSNTIIVTDLTGKVVASKVASSATTIDLSNAGTGIYLVEVSNANGKKVERVVIK